MRTETRMTAAAAEVDQGRIPVLADAPTITPAVRVVVDPGLDERGYIVLGLGDFGDRLFGTPH
jgi:uracil phosphoribosyltransferase